MARNLYTYYRLGIFNIVRVLTYRFFLKIGIYRFLYPIEEATTNPIFQSINSINNHNKNFSYDNKYAEDIISGYLTYFSSKSFYVGSPPNWFKNPYENTHFPNIEYHWSAINELDSSFGDIKTIWEPSRFNWVVHLARTYVVTKDSKYLDTLNKWINDWKINNPPNRGPNWISGQEISIRMLNILLAAHITGDFEQPNNALIKFVQEHCKRISITFQYAKAQNNNHGTSEATAMLVGGAWLSEYGGLESRNLRQAFNWKKKGRKLLEERVLSLVEDDGSFSQYSLNYHRFLLDTLILAEFFMKNLKIQKMSKTYYKRISSAIDWLCHFIDPISGRGPNLGGNDGARLIECSNDDYANFRSTIELAKHFFLNSKIESGIIWYENIFWLNTNNRSKNVHHFTSTIFLNGGYLYINPSAETDKQNVWGMLRYPNFKFRPSHADVFHLDLWVNGVNLLRDGGSFSYNRDEKWFRYFSGTESHNTIQFDGRDQMPRLSKFLFGSWIRVKKIEQPSMSGNEYLWNGEYVDYKGCHHKRELKISNSIWLITDHIANFTELATLRWRLTPGEWNVAENICFGDLAEIAISSNHRIERFEIVTGWESIYYQSLQKIPVLEVDFLPGEISIETKITLKTDTAK